MLQLANARINLCINKALFKKSFGDGCCHKPDRHRRFYVLSACVADALAAVHVQASLQERGALPGAWYEIPG